MTAPVSPQITVLYQGQPAAAAKVYTFRSGGTTTPVTTYSDAALATPNAFPVVADANGQVTLYMSTTTALRLDLYTSDGAFIRTIDPVYPAAISTGGGSVAEGTIPAAATTDLGSLGTTLVNVTGDSVNVTSFGSSALTSNPLYYVRFSGAITLKYNATSMQLIGGADIVTAAGATAIMEYLGDGNWKMFVYQTATGASLSGLSVTGTPASGNLTKFSGGNSVTNADLTGDVTTSGGVATTLATVNSNVGSFTNANVTVNAKGQVTAASNGSNPTMTALGVGSIVLATNSSAVAANATTTGSNLTIVKLASTTTITGGTDSLSGTWLSLQTTSGANQGGLFQRIA